MADSCSPSYIKSRFGDNRALVSALSYEHNQVFEALNKSKAFNKFNGVLYLPTNVAKYTAAKQVIANINSGYASPVVFTDSTLPTGKEYAYVSVLPIAKDIADRLSDTSNLFQLADGAKASPETIGKVKEFLDRIGVKVNEVQDILFNGNKIEANGVAKILEGLIEIVKGKEDTALPEEAAHFAVALIEKKYPQLYKEMFNSIGGFNLFNTVLQDYKGVYTDPQGKPDIKAIKNEAIAQVIAQHVIYNNELHEDVDNSKKVQTWWGKFIEWFKGLFNKAALDPFETAAQKILDNTADLGNVKELDKDEAYLQISKDFISKVVDENSKISLDKEGEPERVGTTLKGSIQKIVNSIYQEKGRTKVLSEDEVQKAKRDYIEATKGKGSVDISDILYRNIDGEGKLRNEALLPTQPSALGGKNNVYRDALEKNIRERLESYPAGTKFLHDVNLYDPKRQIVGKANLLAVRSDNGKVDVLQFKFPPIYGKLGKIGLVDQIAYDREVEEIRHILEHGYGLKKEDFGLTRTIPVRAIYKNVTKENPANGVKLAGIKIGNVDATLEKDDALLPLPSISEVTKDKDFDTLLTKLRGLVKKFENEKVPPAQVEARNKKIKDLVLSIRKLQVQGNATQLLDNAKLQIKQAQAHLERLTSRVEGAIPSEMSTSEMNAIAGDIASAKDDLLLYDKLDHTFEKIFDEDTEVGKAFIDDSSQIANTSSRLVRRLDDLQNKGTLLFGKIVGINATLDPEKQLTWYKRMVRSLSQSETNAGKLLWKLVEPINNALALRFDDKLKALDKLMDEVSEWAKINGGMDAVYKRVFSYDDQGRWKGKFISRTDRVFYHELDTAMTKGDLKWITENIDIKGYTDWYQGELAKREENAKTLRVHPDDQQNELLVARNLESFIEEHDITKKSAVNPRNFHLKAFPLADKWASEEYKELQRHTPLMKLYDHWQEVLKQSHEMGLIASFERRTFFPNVRKEMMEREGFGKANALKAFMDHIRINTEDSTFGNQDPLTGEPIDNVHAAYVYDLGREAKDTDGSYFIDYSNKSMDLFRVMALWEREMIRFELRNETEDIARMIAATESRKQSLRTNKVGSIVTENGTPVLNVNNEINTKYIKDHIDYIWYGKKLSNESDAVFKIPYGAAVQKINNLFHADVLPVPKDEYITVSGIKAVQSFNRYFTLKTLGGNPLTALSQLFGGTVNSYINQGKYFDKADLLEAQTKLASGRFYDERGKLQAGLIDYFIPFLEDRSFEKANELSVNKAIKFLSSEWLMQMQRSADKMVQYPIFMAFAKNTMIKDGKFVNIREFVKAELGYSDIYAGAVGELKMEDVRNRREEIDKRVESLIKTDSILNTTKIVDDKIVFADPSIKRDSDTVIKFRQQVLEFVKDALGNTSPEDLSLYKRSVALQSFFMFKNWIPRMLDVRGQSLKYNAGTNSYEWGRMKMMARALAHDGSLHIGSLLKLLGGNEIPIIERAKQLYIEKQEYFANQRQQFDMSEADFTDMFIKGVRSEMKELALTFSLLGVLVFARIHAPNKDDDPQVKGMYKWTLRAIDKLTDELSFFYDPTSATNIINGGVFPAAGALVDAQRFLLVSMKDAFYYIEGDGNQVAKQRPSKYILKEVPLVNQLINYTAVFNADFAKDWGIQITSQNGRR